MFWCCCTQSIPLCGSNATEYFNELPAFGVQEGDLYPLWEYRPETTLVTLNFPNIEAVDGNLGFGNAITGGEIRYPSQIRFCIGYPSVISAGWGWQSEVLLNAFYDPAECPWDDTDFGWTSAAVSRNQTFFRYDLTDSATAAINHSFAIVRTLFSGAWTRTDGSTWAYEPVTFRSTLECTTYNATFGYWYSTLNTYVDDVLWKTQTVFVYPNSHGYILLRGFFLPSYYYDHLNYYPGSDALKWQIDSFIFSYTD